METKIFNISNNKELTNGTWYKKESLNNVPGCKINDIVNVKQIYGETETTIIKKTREELISLVEEGGLYAFQDLDFGDYAGIADMLGWEEPEWRYIYCQDLF